MCCRGANLEARTRSTSALRQRSCEQHDALMAAIGACGAHTKIYATKLEASQTLAAEQRHMLQEQDHTVHSCKTTMLQLEAQILSLRQELVLNTNVPQDVASRVRHTLINARMYALPCNPSPTRHIAAAPNVANVRHDPPGSPMSHLPPYHYYPLSRRFAMSTAHPLCCTPRCLV